MEKKKKKKLWLLILIIIISIMIAIYMMNNNSSNDTGAESTEITETTVIKTDILNTISNSSYIQSALTENKELHATYYFEEIYFEENQYISEGENILKYTNGEYMVAPYNCVITAMSIPNSEEICTNKHYLTLQSTDTLKISLEIGEDELNTIYVGQEARIEVETLDNKNVIGYVTSIDNTANYSSSGSTFGVDVEFPNNGEILLGMSAKCSVVLEKAEGVIAVANEAITEQNNKKYVTVKSSDGTTKEIEIEVGIENDAYTEVKNGLNEGDIVLIEETQESSMQNIMGQKNQMDRQQGGFSQEQGGGERPEMPSGGSMTTSGEMPTR